MTERSDGRAAIVVGVDGSRAGTPAVDWAAHEAALTRRPLQLVYALDRQVHETQGWPVQTVNENAGRRVLAIAEARVRELEPEVRIRSEISTRPAPDALILRSDSAHETVVGQRGHGTPGRWVLGSASLRVVTLASGPVVVVPGNPYASDNEIVAAVDGSSIGGTIVEYAFAQAERRGTTLRVIHAWQPPNSLFSDHYPFDLFAAEHKAHTIAEEWINRIGPRFPDVKATSQVVRDHPARALGDAAKHAALLVMGSRGRTGASRFFLGSVSTAVLHHAHCPVAVLPTGSRPPEDLAP